MGIPEINKAHQKGLDGDPVYEMHIHRRGILEQMAFEDGKKIREQRMASVGTADIGDSLMIVGGLITFFGCVWLADRVEPYVKPVIKWYEKTNFSKPFSDLKDSAEKSWDKVRQPAVPDTKEQLASLISTHPNSPSVFRGVFNLYADQKEARVVTYTNALNGGVDKQLHYILPGKDKMTSGKANIIECRLLKESISQKPSRHFYSLLVRQLTSGSEEISERERVEKTAQPLSSQQACIATAVRLQ